MDGSGFQGGLTAQRSFDVWKEDWGVCFIFILNI